MEKLLLGSEFSLKRMGLAIFLISFFISLLQGFNITDESWFLQVVHRITNGEILYKDVFFGVPPLSAYLAGLFTRIFGAEILVMKAILSICFTASILISCLIAKQLEIREKISLPFIIAFFSFSHCTMIWSGALYNPLANLLFLATLAAFLHGLKMEGASSFFLAAVFAALSFCSKHSTGMCAFGSLLASLFFVKSKPSLLLGVFISFIVTVLLVLLPVFLDGGFDKFIYYAFINKQIYIQYGTVPYFALENFRSYLFPIFILPFLAFTGLFFLRERSQTGILAIFLGGSVLSAFPRADASHVTFTVPFSLICILFSFHYLRDFIPGLLKKMSSAWVLAVFVYILVKPCIQVSHQNGFDISHFPHFHGVPVSSEFKRNMRYQLKNIKKIEGNVFFLTPGASFYYLASGIKNVTPFDYPLVTVFGREGTREVFNLISTAVDHVFVERVGGALKPSVIENYVEQNLMKSLIPIPKRCHLTLYEKKT